MIKIQGLHKFFNKGRQNEIHVINDVSLELPEKGMVAIFGKSGCGKTTLLNVIGGLDKFAQGALTIEGQSILENTDDLRNRYIGYIFQNYNLNKEESCFDNVADALRLCGMADGEEMERRVTAALANVGMKKYSKRFPDTLSGGQQQRIAIARAIVKNPRIILADEPTGNLDEANTVMIMDLLKAISKDHLVILVTHEANLVDYYCDTVIELSDGKVVSTKINTAANGFAARDKNDIYLGELEQTALANETAQIEYFGEKPEEPIKLKIVNHGGKLYLQIDSAKVQILDEFSEVKLKAGSYREKISENAVSQNIDMSALPPVEGTAYGKLFSLRSSVKSGYHANFKQRKKSKKILRNCMCLFAAVVVFMSAVFGGVFGDIINARNAYNHNVFYIYTPDIETSQKLNQAVESGEAGVDFLRLMTNYPQGDEYAYFHLGSFETFTAYSFDSNLITNAVYLDETLLENKEVLAGKASDLNSHEMVISSKVADALLEKSTLGFISEYRDLIGLVSDRFTINGQKLRIAGVVACDETSVYMSALALAKYVRTGFYSSYVSPASDYGVFVQEGEAVLYLRDRLNGVEYPAVGERIMIQGREVEVKAIKEFCFEYSGWLMANGIEKPDVESFFKALLKQEQPALSEKDQGYTLALEELMERRFFEYYDSYYSEIRSFYQDYYLFQPDDFDVWLYLEKGVEIGKFYHMSKDYYKAVKYKELYGRYPTQKELESVYEDLPYYEEDIKELLYLYEDEYYSRNYSAIYENRYLISDADYIATSKQLGLSHPTASSNGDYYYKEMVDTASVISSDVVVDSIYGGDICYTLLHSTDPQKTAAWLEENFGDLEPPYTYWEAILTPDMIFQNQIASNTDEIVTGLVTMAVILVLMSLCMYFIMRSSLLNRIKEVGIYRAIGVSKKNLIFKFFIEAVVLTSLTVFVGYLLTSGFLFLCLGLSPLVAEIFYYPMWLAGIVLVILYALSLFCGTLPILSLLRKTPSEILAKYDI